MTTDLISDYDEKTVDEIAGILEERSFPEDDLLEIASYEQANKDRTTLLQILDREIGDVQEEARPQGGADNEGAQPDAAESDDTVADADEDTAPGESARGRGGPNARGRGGPNAGGRPDEPGGGPPEGARPDLPEEAAEAARNARNRNEEFDAASEELTEVELVTLRPLGRYVAGRWLNSKDPYTVRYTKRIEKAVENDQAEIIYRRKTTETDSTSETSE